MLNRFFHDQGFAKLMQTHIREMIELLLKKGQYFSILTNVAEIEFDPILPHEISSHFKPITLFVIAEYTFESCSVDSENLYFEAGFGQQNVGSYVTVPLSAIVQIILEDTPILINLSIKHEPPENHSIEKSTNIFLSNPENKRFKK